MPAAAWRCSTRTEREVHQELGIQWLAWMEQLLMIKAIGTAGKHAEGQLTVAEDFVEASLVVVVTLCACHTRFSSATFSSTVSVLFDLNIQMPSQAKFSSTPLPSKILTWYSLETLSKERALSFQLNRFISECSQPWRPRASWSSPRQDRSLMRWSRRTRGVFRPHIQHDVQLFQHGRVPGPDHARVREGGGVLEQEAAQGLVGVEGAGVGADGRHGALAGRGGRQRHAPGGGAQAAQGGPGARREHAPPRADQLGWHRGGAAALGEFEVGEARVQPRRWCAVRFTVSVPSSYGR